MCFAKCWASLALCGVISSAALAQDAVPAPGSSPTVKKKAQSLKNWFETQIASRIKISGYRRVGYHQHDVTGDREAYNLSTAYGMGDKRFTDVGSVYVSGRNVLGLLNFDFNIQDSRYQDPQGQKFAVDVKRGPWSVGLGDIRGSLLNTNRFLRFEKTLRGASVGYKSGAFEVKALTTEVRGEPRTISIAGLNTPGPYFLQSNQIVRGSERVSVDGIDQEFGKDYTIDYDLGAITFVNRSTLEGKIIPPTSTILATYEVFGFSGEKGTLYGGGLTYDFGKAGRLGITAVQQKTGGEGRLSTRLEKFQGFGAPGTPYFLQFEPLAGTLITIRVDGVLQTEGVDYNFDPDNSSIFYFTRFMPTTSNIDVLYTPKPTKTVSGDRQTLGLDYQIPLGHTQKVGDKKKFVREGTITLSHAFGKLTNTPTPTSGTAKGVDVRWGQGKITAAASWREVPDGYVSVETIGFNRNEKAADLRFSYKPSSKYTYTVGWNNSAISQTQTQNDGSVKVFPTRFTSAQGSVDFQAGGGGSSWVLSHTRTAGSNASGTTTIDTTSLDSGRKFGRLTTQYSLQNQFASGPANGQNKKLNRQGLELRTSYNAGRNWAMNFNTGLSRLATDGQTGIGRDIQMGVSYRNGENFSSILQYIDSDAGKISSLSGFSSGYGYGYDGNGFSGGAGGNTLIGVSTYRRLTWSNNVRVNDRLNFGLGGVYNRTEGSVSSNTATTSFILGVDYDIGANTRFNSTVGYDNTEYVGSGQKSNAKTLQFSLDGAPPGRFTYSLGASGLFTGGTSLFQQDSYNAFGSLNYYLGGRHALALTTNLGRTRGYLPQTSAETFVTYKYQIWKSLAFNVSYAWRDIRNSDPLQSSGAYRSRGFDFELAFNFG